MIDDLTEGLRTQREIIRSEIANLGHEVREEIQTVREELAAVRNTASEAQVGGLPLEEGRWWLLSPSGHLTESIGRFQPEYFCPA